MSLDSVIYGGTIVSAQGRYQASVGIKDGKIVQIAAVHETLDAPHVIDATGKYIIPGAIDAHVHFEDPGRPDREDFMHGTAACAVGGVTTCLIMPTNDPLILNLHALSTNLKAWENRAYVDYGVHGGADDSSIADTESLWVESGVTAIKVFMCRSSPNMGFVNDEILYQTMETMQRVNGFMIIHAENDGIINFYEKHIHAAGRRDYLSFSESRPGFGEVEAIRRAVFFLKQTGASALFPHVSTAEGLMEIKKAKDEGVRVFAEVTPQHYTFTTKDLQEKGPYVKFTPIMHDEANLNHMWELIKKGYVDTIGSDHSPYSVEEKEAGMEDIWKAPNGIPGIEVELATFLNAVNQGKLELEDVVRMNSLNPSKIFNLPNKGRIEVGYDADVVIVDMELEKEFTTDDIQSKCTWSPYLGRKFKGWPVVTLVRGEVVAQNGKLVGKKGYGRLVSRLK